MRKMTLDEARRVRKFRVDDDLTWRGVAMSAFEEGLCGAGDDVDWGAIPSNQLVGMDLCREAAPFFGEDWSKEPWN
jgi:hypothetical protein